ncbi:MAG: hypothetical protein Kow0010_04980 [Dehalococcoidia bacterium]
MSVAVRGSPGDAQTFVPPRHPARPAAVLAQASSARFTVRYVNMPPQARDAFDWAVRIWENWLTSPVPIAIEARWEPLQPGLWGIARFEHTYRNFDGAPSADTWYPIPLANALAGEDLMPGVVDIVATFNSGTDWYFGIDGQTPAGKADFVTLALHEVGHGLGIGTTFAMAGQLAGAWGGDGGFPFVFDLFVVDGAGQALTDTAIYPNPSLALGVALQGGDLYFDGANARAANAGLPPKLHAPHPWENLSSVLHLDEATYPAGHPDSLMTPFFSTAEAVHDPGPIVLGILRDLGWAIGGPPECHALSLKRNGNGSATADPDRSPGCDEGSYSPGDVLTLTATAGANWLFASWLATAGAPACASCATTAYTMPAGPATVTATFVDRATLSERRLAPLVARDPP